ncbi:MAG: hypothetical protein Q9195_006500 [Heterodermia aff. obscurata]
MSDVARSPTSSVLEGMDRGFTPVNPGSKIQITSEQAVPSSTSKAKSESSVKAVQPNQIKAKVWSAMHDPKTMLASRANPGQAMAKAKDVKKPKDVTKSKPVTPSLKPALKPKPNVSQFLMTEAKAPVKAKKVKVQRPSPESGDESGLDDQGANGEKASDLNIREVTNRNKTTVSKLVQALSDRGLATKGNRAQVTARFLLYELGLDTNGEDTGMQTYCMKLLAASMPELKTILGDLGQKQTGTNKPDIVSRVLKASYQVGDSDDDEGGSSSEGDDDSDEEGSKRLPTPSTSPDNIKEGKKRARAVAEDSEDEDASPKRQKVAPSDDDSETKEVKFEPNTNGAVSNTTKSVVDKQKKRRRSDESDLDNPEKKQAKKLKLTDPKPKPKDKISAAEIGRAVRAKSNSSASKAKPPKKATRKDNHFVFSDELDSRTLFENVLVPADVLSTTLRVITGCGTIKDINVVHDFRHPLPLYKLYREGKLRENAKQCPKAFLAAQEFYEEREQELEESIYEAERKEDEENEMDEDEDDLEFEDEKAEQLDEEMTDEDDEDIDDLIMTAPVDESSVGGEVVGEDVAVVYQKAHCEDVQKEQDEADDLRGKSLHPSEITYLDSIPAGTTLESYYDNLWEPESDEEGHKNQKLQSRNEEIALMKMAKVEVGSEDFKKIRWSHDGKW